MMVSVLYPRLDPAPLLFQHTISPAWAVELMLDWDPLMFILILMVGGLFAMHLLWR